MRKIVLELAEDTTSELCGHCRALAAFRGNVILARSCSAFRATMDTKGPAMRVDECLAAERTASRLLDEAHAVLRVGNAIRAHAKKAEVKP